MFNGLIEAARYADPLPDRWRGWLSRSRWFTGLRELRRDLLFSRMTAMDVRDNEKMRRMYAYVLRRGSNCVDVGAHSGDFLRLFLDLAPLGRHLAVEPLPEYCGLLRRDFPQVQIEQVALSNKCGTANFTIVEKCAAWSGLRQSDYPWATKTQVIAVHMATLDSLLPPDLKPDLLKIDVEGAELEVFQGSIETLRRHRPYLVFEHFVNAYRSYGMNSSELWRLLADCGYRIFDLDGNRPLSMEAFVDVSDSGERWYFFAHE